MQIYRFTVLSAVVLCVWEVSTEETKTFPGAEIIIPAVIAQVAPAIIGAIIGGIGGGTRPPVRPISASHTTSLATSIANKPIVVSSHFTNSHSGSISTTSSTIAGSHASAAGPSSLVSSSSSAGANTLEGISKRWQTFFKNIR
ncbi:uncharacterized protein LOC134217128 isoform X1 [Armigeres subalbatus]|uniref:uncharacterized protein LOC134217128 isoform X1 n=1 Tax=Armigeres subalbatus TaxID=124917 RepID=UPI002ED050D6